MTARTIQVREWPSVRGGAPRRLLAPSDALVLDVARVVVAIVLVVLVLAGMAATATFLAGPMPVEGPQPGFAL